jgi:hypothetical protein
MKKVSGYIAFIACLACVLFFSSNAVGQEEEIKVTGKIIEIAAAEYIIQVKNRNYIVTSVFIDDGVKVEPTLGYFGDLKVGSVVELHVMGKSDGFWKAKEVIVFKGDKEKEALKNLN